MGKQLTYMHTKSGTRAPASRCLVLLILQLTVVVTPCTTTNAEYLWVSVGCGNCAQLGGVLLGHGTHDVPVKLLARAAVQPKAQRRMILFVKLTPAVLGRSRFLESC